MKRPVLTPIGKVTIGSAFTVTTMFIIAIGMVAL